MPIFFNFRGMSDHGHHAPAPKSSSNSSGGGLKVPSADAVVGVGILATFFSLLVGSILGIGGH